MRYNIKDASGTIINTINASAEFVEANFEHFEEQVIEGVEPSAAEQAREWRDIELSSTDHAAMVPDYPNREAIMAYRTLLRDWPSTEDFPATKPVLGE
tara:strand:+ start:543 stop:836 length:294 start_codon:yes stop_codon:yes gene_type:complete